MKTTWDYTELADAYLKRPDYAQAAIDALLAISGVREADPVCDVGAGVAHLTLLLGARELTVTAVEPNDAMRENGIIRTKDFKNVNWHEGTGEDTGQKEKSFSLVTFGSSFNVCNRSEALKETARLLKPNGWFACMWNHRDLEDPIQKKLEEIIASYIPGYGYGSRREDQRQVIEQSGLFGPVVQLTGQVIHEQYIVDCVEAWRSHATLERQAGESFHEIVTEIESYLSTLGRPSIEIPYSTRIWCAQLND